MIDGHRPPAQRVAVTLVAAAAAALVVLLQVNIGDGFGNSLDAGWGEVLNWGLVHGAQWGKDLVFTYGPLGFLIPGIPFDPATYWSTLLLQHVFAAVTACLVVDVLRRLPLFAGLAFLLATIVLGYSWSTSAALLMVYPLAGLALEQASRSHRPDSIGVHALVAALAAYTALMPLIKFSTFPLWLAWLPLGTVILWRAAARRLVATFAAASVLGPLLAWWLSGQQLENLSRFVTTSWQVAIHYGAAMQANPPDKLADCVALGTTLFGVAYTALLAWRSRRSARRVAVCVLFALTLTLTYRASATRADGGHLGILWSVSAWCAPLLVGMLHGTPAHQHRKDACMAFLLMILALAPEALSGVYPAYTLQQSYGGHYTFAYARQHLEEIWSPRATYERKLREWTVDRAKLAMPELAHEVGRNSVDVLMNDQSVLLANDLNYDPRPVFQSYSAYSGHLARLNAAFFSGPRAPRWVMLDWGAIDGRYPSTDDALALLSVLRAYRPIASHGDFVLFRSDPRAREQIDDWVADAPRELALGFKAFTRVPLSPSAVWFARLDVQLTPLGKLRSLLFRAPKLRVDVRTRDGATHRYTLVRAVGRSGFMLSPAIENNGQYLDWLDADNGREVAALKLVQRHFLGGREFRVAGPLRLYPLALPRTTARTLALYAARYPGFNTLPDSISGEHKIFTVDARKVLFLPAPGSMAFRLRPGTYDVSAQFGVMPNALTDAGCMRAKPDGIGLELHVTGQPEDSTTAAYLDPFSDPLHRYATDFSHRLVVPPGQTVELATTSGPPGSNGACDWSWIRAVRFEPVPKPY